MTKESELKNLKLQVVYAQATILKASARLNWIEKRIYELERLK